MAEPTVHIGVLSIEFFIPASESLKTKRRVLLSFKERARNQFNISISEIDHHDKWQHALFGAVMIGNDKKHIQSVLDNVVNLAETIADARVLLQRIEFV